MASSSRRWRERGGCFVAVSARRARSSRAACPASRRRDALTGTGSRRYAPADMKPLISRDLWQWIEENRESFEPPVGNRVIWEDSQFTAMIIRGPNARRDFHDDPSDEIFHMLRGSMVLEVMEDGQRRERIIR